MPIARTHGVRENRPWGTTVKISSNLLKMGGGNLIGDMLTLPKQNGGGNFKMC